MYPVFLGLAGPELTDAERALFQQFPPAGFILFQRNCETPAQVRALTADLRALAGRDRLAILIDQEGGRVQRLKPPQWLSHPPGSAFVALAARDRARAREAVRLHAAALGWELRSLGITVDCYPLLDVLVSGADPIIGDRAFGDDPALVADLGRAALDGLRGAGIVGVVKHIPGHGRASVDSHLSLPVVDASRADLERDFAPFAALADAPMAMTAHVVYTALDPAECATTSAPVIGGIIRGAIGFDGLLMSDDLGMKALEGDFGARARRSLDAGCDIALHCSGDMVEMTAIVSALQPIAAAARRRLDAALAWPHDPAPEPAEAMAARLALARDALLA